MLLIFSNWNGKMLNIFEYARWLIKSKARWKLENVRDNDFRVKVIELSRNEIKVFFTIHENR